MNYIIGLAKGRNNNNAIRSKHTMTKLLSETNSKRLLWLGVILFFFGIFLFIWRESFSVDSKIDSEKVAQLGDSIGGIIGSIWSLAGVILFYVALTEQRVDIQTNRDALKAQVKALNQQIEEFGLQRIELEETRKVFKEQSETLTIQRFENTFFQLLSLHHDLVDKLKFSKPTFRKVPLNYEKREVLIQGYKDLTINIEYNNSKVSQSEFGSLEEEKNPPTSREEATSRLRTAFHKFYFKDYNQTLSHYFRNIYHVFKFIYMSDLIKSDKKQFYASLVRAQLSSEELFLILYNSLMVGLGYPNFLFFIKHFDILQNFDFKQIDRFPYHKEIFEEIIKDVVPEFEQND
jgi:hypothetical protein